MLLTHECHADEAYPALFFLLKLLGLHHCRREGGNVFVVTRRYFIGATVSVLALMFLIYCLVKNMLSNSYENVFICMLESLTRVYCIFMVYESVTWRYDRARFLTTVGANFLATRKRIFKIRQYLVIMGIIISLIILEELEYPNLSVEPRFIIEDVVMAFIAPFLLDYHIMMFIHPIERLLQKFVGNINEISSVYASKYSKLGASEFVQGNVNNKTLSRYGNDDSVFFNFRCHGNQQEFLTNGVENFFLLVRLFNKV